MSAKILFVLFLLFSSLFAKEECNLFQTEGELGFERSELSGTFKVGGDDSTTLDTQKDLGMQKSTARLKAMMSKSTTHHKFGFKLEKYKHSGSKKLSSNIIYNGSQYATASLIKSKISLKWAKLKYRYRFTPDFSLGIDLNGMRLKTMVNENKKKKTLLLPAIALEYQKELEEGLNFIIKGTSTAPNENSHHYGYVGFSYNMKILGCSCLHLGYQYRDLKINSDDIHANLKFQGLYAGLSMKF